MRHSQAQAVSSNETDNFTSSLPGLLPRLSSTCLLYLEERLTCNARHIADNSSQLICEPKEGDDPISTDRAYKTFVAVVTVTVILAVALNLVVLLTICLNKKLHTLTSPPATTAESEIQRQPSDSPTPGPSGYRREAVLEPSTLDSTGPENAAAVEPGGSPDLSQRDVAKRSVSAAAAARLLPVAEVARPAVRRTGRVDVVATMAMITYLLTFLISFAPILAVSHYTSDLKCVVMPSERYYIFTMITTSGGVTAVLNPLVCVIFSKDFREAFIRSFHRCVRCVLNHVEPLR
ncbi:hypothetical protein FJT64_012863 [Amphibalanus amphitrite]|uniref:G-protein coupled receptors family 1 profile domain-containing protein n=1 Tax=Amphibalanus amphitrite TaxID=1232801 RepID=A0A6A4UY90_AMPAM|nr:hypothetical protein FJT64_012863 [Amphibalanus amphitrite]